MFVELQLLGRNDNTDDQRWRKRLKYEPEMNPVSCL